MHRRGMTHRLARVLGIHDRLSASALATLALLVGCADPDQVFTSSGASMGGSDEGDSGEDPSVGDEGTGGADGGPAEDADGGDGITTGMGGSDDGKASEGGSDEGETGGEAGDSGTTGDAGDSTTTDAGDSDSTGDSGESEGAETAGESGSDGGGGTQFVPSLNQAAWVEGTTTYEFGYNSIPTIPIAGAPEDTDWSRSAMLHDGEVYRLYFMPEGRADAVYQFGYDPVDVAYEYGHESIPTIPIEGTPAQADTSSFAMLHDGETYRLYFLSQDAPLRLYQHGYDPSEGAYIYGHDSIPQIEITDTPAGTDWSGWGMLHDGEYYRLYAFGSGSHDTIVQHAFDGSTYRWGHQSVPELNLSMIPADSDTSEFMMLHDTEAYRFYMLTMP